MNTKQKRIIEKLRAVLAEAGTAGLVIAVDSDAVCLRVLSKEDYKDCSDLHEKGIAISVDDACGGSAGMGPDEVSGAYAAYNPGLHLR